MKMQDRVVLILALLVVVASGLWWLVGRTPAAAPPPAAPAADHPTGDAAAVADPANRPPDGAAESARSSAAARTLPGTWVDVGSEFGGPKRPFVIGLHGRGDTAAHFSAVAARLGPGMRWRFLEGPVRWRDGAAWFSRQEGEGAATEMARAIALVQAHAESARGRPIALVGFSQGCMTALQVVLAHPRLVDAVVCIGGRMLREPRMPVAPRQTRLLFVHGAADTTVPIADARRAIQVMENRGFMTEIIEHGGGHEIPAEETGRIARWLAERLGAVARDPSRRPSPAGVELNPRSALDSRAVGDAGARDLADTGAARSAGSCSGTLIRRRPPVGRVARRTAWPAGAARLPDFVVRTMTCVRLVRYQERRP